MFSIVSQVLVADIILIARTLIRGQRTAKFLRHRAPTEVIYTMYRYMGENMRLCDCCARTLGAVRCKSDRGKQRYRKSCQACEARERERRK